MGNNKKLREAISRGYRNQYLFAAHMKIAPAVVSQVVTGRYNLSDIEKESWAYELGESPADLWPKAVTI